MSRPSVSDISSGVQGWDALLNDWKDVLLDGPFAIKEYADEATLLAVDPTTYDRCLAVTANTATLWVSTGTAWVAVGNVGSPKGAFGAIKVNEATSSALSSGTSYTFTGLRPAKRKILGVTMRIDTEVTGPTDLDLGDGSDVDRYAAATALTAGTTTDGDDATADPEDAWNASARDVVLTANGGAFTAGVVTASCYYIELLPQSA